MSLAWRVVKLAASDFIDDILWLVVLNVLWCVAAITVVAMPLVSGGMAWVAAEIGEGKVVNFRTFLVGVRRYWKQAYVWGLINLVVGALVGMNIFFYLGQQESWFALPLVLFVAIGLWWVGTQFYFFPFLVHQDPPSIKMAYRNSLVLMLSQPAVSLALFFVVMILAAISYLLLFPLFLLFFGLLSVLSNRAVIETIKSQQEREEAAKESSARDRVRDRRWRP